ncbi:ATP-binding protein involved in chromosome partitioning [Parelusimicrobium proximum]|uniref:P-loop NTPase n=1 Tax=Parelusimicrobium proximum TaxID=3228953 RepID=UPI003D180AA1
MQINLDPRPFAINERLKNIKKIIAVSGFKGGVGKSSVACALALVLAASGKKTGLADLDFAGSSCDTILGAELGYGKLFPDEIEGLKPPVTAGVEFMSINYFSDNRAVHLRGAEISSTIVELLSVTNWGELDYLILDMPPGLSDTTLDILKLVPQAEILAVSTPSVLSANLVKTSLDFLINSGAKVYGILENFSDGKEHKFASAQVLARIPRDENFESYIGHPAMLLKSEMAAQLKKIV